MLRKFEILRLTKPLLAHIRNARKKGQTRLALICWQYHYYLLLGEAQILTLHFLNGQVPFLNNYHTSKPPSAANENTQTHLYFIRYCKEISSGKYSISNVIYDDSQRAT